MPLGGPNGGDGGKGGDVILEADPQLSTLIDYHYRRHYKAEKGQNGRGKNQHGKSGEDIILKVPIGTIVYDAKTNQVIADLNRPYQRVIVAKGGRGGRGNTHFVTPTNTAPRIAEKGEEGEAKWIRLELHLLADVGIIGLPNVGKSTLLSKVSSAHPKIAPYPFTTVQPVLGVVRVDEFNSFVMADIPGLIEDSHKGKGLGISFLRHIRRCKLLLHLLDATRDDLLKDYETVNKELKLYDENLANYPQMVAVNKIDLLTTPLLKKKTNKLREAGLNPFFISALKGTGVRQLLYEINERLKSLSNFQIS